HVPAGQAAGTAGGDRDMARRPRSRELASLAPDPRLVCRRRGALPHRDTARPAIERDRRRHWNDRHAHRRIEVVGGLWILDWAQGRSVIRALLRLEDSRPISSEFARFDATIIVCLDDAGNIPPPDSRTPGR